MLTGIDGLKANAFGKGYQLLVFGVWRIVMAQAIAIYQDSANNLQGIRDIQAQF